MPKSVEKGHFFGERMFAFEVVRANGCIEVHLSPVIDMPTEDGPIKTRDQLQRLLAKSLDKRNLSTVVEIRAVKNLKVVRDVEWFLEGMMFQMLDYADHPKRSLKNRPFYFIGRRVTGDATQS
jgi:hypothetical protein